VGNGRLQLDSDSGAAHRIQHGFSGSPVVDDSTGRVVGLLATAPVRMSERDSFAIEADRLRLEWPESLGRRITKPGREQLTILHLSDTQFGKHHLFGGNGLTEADRDRDSLFGRLHDDLDDLRGRWDLRPDLVVVTGDLAEWGLRSEFQQVARFLALLSESTEVPRRHIAVVPGNHDINRKACEAYFREQESDEREPVAPYWPKWRQFVATFKDFYADVSGVTFTPDEPWTLFEMPDLGVVVAGLNATMAESHRDEDHYGSVGEHQLRWFADRLRGYRERGWFRLAAVHHNVVRGAVDDDENLRDADDLDRILGTTKLVNLLLHGHTHDGRLHRLPSGLIALSTGSAAVDAAARPTEVPNQYQLLTVNRGGFTRCARQYAVVQRRWIGDNRISDSGSDWRVQENYEFDNVGHALRSASLSPLIPKQPPEDRPAAGRGGDSFLDRVVVATSAREPGAKIVVRLDEGYLRLQRPLPTGGVEMWPVGVVEGPLTERTIEDFAKGVHTTFAAADPNVQSQLVYAGSRAPESLVASARRQGLTALSFVEYQGLLDLGPLVAGQNERLATDQLYPPGLYVSQRFRLLPRRRTASEQDIQAGLLEQTREWLGASEARLVMVLGDFGRGKTSLLRELARTLPEEVPSVLPVLVELRGLEKAPGLDGLLAQHLANQGVDDIRLDKLRYMIHSGRMALLFDGFDELELRVGYDNAAEYLQTLLSSVTDRAKVVLTSRTQHFQNDNQVRTALGARVDDLAGSRVVVLEDFNSHQVLQFLTNRYGNETQAQARYELLSEIEDLLGLSRNPRMLGFIADLEEERLRAVREERGRISAADLYREIIDRWLTGEEARQSHKRGVKSLAADERLAACRTLALKLWGSKATTLPAADLPAAVTSELTGLVERGYSAEQAGHAIGSGSLLVRTEEGNFGFIHQSVMEWLVASAAAESVGEVNRLPIKSVRQMSKLMIDFFCDMAGHDVARLWAEGVLRDSAASEISKQNALAVQIRLPEGDRSIAGENLAGVDLRSQDLTNRNLRGANLRGANLNGMRLVDVDFTGAELSGADFRGARLVGGSLKDSMQIGAQWDRAALLGVAGVENLRRWPELQAAAIAGHDSAELMRRWDWARIGDSSAVAFSPDGSLLAVGFHTVVDVVDVTTLHSLRILSGQTGDIQDVVFSPDGSLVAAAFGHGGARLWDAVSGEVRMLLSGDEIPVCGLAFSPDGSSLAIASPEGSAQLRDVVSGELRVTLPHGQRGTRDVAFSPDGLLAVAFDGLLEVVDVSTLVTVRTMSDVEFDVPSVTFSPDGSLIAAITDNGQARLWDVASGEVRVTLSSGERSIRTLGFSPDGSVVAAGTGNSQEFDYDDGAVELWEVATGRRVAEMAAGDAVNQLAVSPDGTLLAATTATSARLWNLPSGDERGDLPQHGSTLSWAVAFSPDGSLLATTSSTAIQLWDVGSGNHRASLARDTGTIYGVTFSPDGSLLASGSDDGTARIWDVATHAEVARLTHPNVHGLRGIAFSPDGLVLATTSLDRNLRLWDVGSWHLRRTLKHDEWLWGVAFSPDGSYLATTGIGTVRLWDVKTGKERAQLTHADNVRSVAFSPDGSLFASTGDDWTAKLWDVSSWSLRHTLVGHHGWVLRGAFSPDGSLLATAGNDGTARIWETADGSLKRTITVNAEEAHGVWDVAFSPDGALLATTSTSPDDTKLWSVETGEQRAAFFGLSGGGCAALFPDGSYVLNGDPGDDLWWAIKLCRFAPGELDPYVPGLRNRSKEN
jgi:WD40 repeat protein/3',5'-cyclic AMP phosphodiesterase CpdA